VEVLVEEDEDGAGEAGAAVEVEEEDDSDVLDPEPSDFFSAADPVVTGVVDLPEPRLSFR